MGKIKNLSNLKPKKEKHSFPLSVISVGNVFFKLSGKIGKFLFCFSWALATSDVNMECLCSFWPSHFGKQIDLFFVAFWVEALLLNMSVLAMSLCELFISFCNLVGLSFINIPSQLLEYNVPLLFFLSGFPSQYRLQYRLVSSSITNTVFYLRGWSRAKGRMNLLSTF